MAREDNFDLINLDGPLSVEAILKTLQQRFMEGHCYTWVGPVLLCINPFEAPGPAVHAVLKRLCEQVLQEMSQDQQPHALIFKGVCGSGKSFTADRLLLEMFQNTKRTDWLQDIRKYWQVSTVVLRALGTASNEQNKDASRIGRVVDFTIAELKIIKIKMNCFFLDQTRLVSPNAREQNYHIFYQMLAGLSPEERTKYQLNYHDMRTLHYLSQGMEPAETVPQLQSRFEAWKSSLAQLGIPLTDVLKVLSAILLLGNTLFYEAKNQELQLQGMEELTSVATLLGVQPQNLQRGLTLRTYRSSRGPSVQSPCSAAAANGARDALAKALYIRTMVAVMRRINTLLRGVSQKTHVGGVNSTGHAHSSEPTLLHVVDMFGFENSEVNSLEQLCVNWTAEQLQHHYIQSLFSSAISRCTDEGVDPMFETPPYDCSPCLKLIGGEDSGLLEMLNEETMSPRVSSEDIRVRMRQKFKESDRFIPPTGSSSTFAIRHYCGTVIYDTYSLLNANADTVADDIIATFDGKVCKFGFVAHLFSVELSRDLLPDGTPRGQMSRITPAYLQQASNPDNRSATTYVQDYQSNVQESLGGLLEAQPHHVVCLTSNDKQTPGHFDKEVVGQQIQNMAIFETVDFMQCAYTRSQMCEGFIERYSSLVSPVGSPHSTAREIAEEMMRALVGGALANSDLAEDSFALGNSLIFMTEELYQQIEGLRRERLHSAAVKIQAAVRMFLCRRQWPHLKFSLRQAKLQGQAHTQLIGGVDEGRVNGGQLSYSVRNYSIVGGYKVGFPQWRTMRCQYPESGPSLLQAGEEVYCLGRSQKRGYLVVEHGGGTVHIPHHYTELRLTPPNSPPPTGRPQPHTSDL